MALTFDLAGVIISGTSSSDIDAQIVDSGTASDALRAMLHGIFFHRLFGVVKPAKIDCLDVTFPAVKDADTEKLVDDTVQTFLRALQSLRQSRKEGQIEIFFAEKKPKKATWFHSGGEVRISLLVHPDCTYSSEQEEVPWETWIINVTLEQPQHDQDRERLLDTLSATLAAAVMSMLDYSASERGRTAVPPISTATGISPFPIHTILRVNGQIVS